MLYNIVLDTIEHPRASRFFFFFETVSTIDASPCPRRWSSEQAPPAASPTPETPASSPRFSNTANASSAVHHRTLFHSDSCPVASSPAAAAGAQYHRLTAPGTALEAAEWWRWSHHHHHCLFDRAVVEQRRVSVQWVRCWETEDAAAGKCATFGTVSPRGLIFAWPAWPLLLLRPRRVQRVFKTLFFSSCISESNLCKFESRLLWDNEEEPRQEQWLNRNPSVMSKRFSVYQERGGIPHIQY